MHGFQNKSLKSVACVCIKRLCVKIWQNHAAFEKCTHADHLRYVSTGLHIIKTEVCGLSFAKFSRSKIKLEGENISSGLATPGHYITTTLITTLLWWCLCIPVSSNHLLKKPNLTVLYCHYHVLW